MGHHLNRSVYADLTDRLNRFPQGAPPSRHLFAILKILFSERDAELVAQLPLRPFTARRAAAIWKVSVDEARRLLDGLASRALLVDFEEAGVFRYVLPRPMAGFFEFSMMRVRGDIDQALLAELFSTSTWRRTSSARSSREERPSSGAPSCTSPRPRPTARSPCSTTSGRARSSAPPPPRRRHCYCRHKMAHRGKACAAPLESA